MKKNIFAVCDLEASYAYNFMEYMSRKKNIPFEIQAFTHATHLCNYGKEHPIAILLISDKAMCKEVEELNIEKIMILSEGTHYPSLDQYPSIYKYQSSDAVIREVMACYGESKASDTAMQIAKKKTKILGIYSPLGRVLKTSFALTLGQVLAKDKAVLYLNLEEYAGFEQLFGKAYERNLSDLIYYLRQNQSNLMFKLNSMTESVNNLDYLPPVLAPMDIRGTTYEEWLRLVQEIVENSSYEVLILDFGDGVEELYHLMDVCERIYMPVLKDTMSMAKIKQFEELLSVWDCGEVLQKIQKIKPPFHNGSGTGELYVQQLVWSELGDYVKELLRKGEENEIIRTIA